MSFRKKKISLVNSKTDVNILGMNNLLDSLDANTKQATVRNNLYREELKSRDRVDISKEEYLKLLDDIKKLEKDNAQQRETIYKLLKPIASEEGGEYLIQTILSGKAKIIKARISTFPSIDFFTKQIAILYEVEYDER